jgi:hypothetical protein
VLKKNFHEGLLKVWVPTCPIFGYIKQWININTSNM